MIIIRKDTVWGPGLKNLTDDVQIAPGVTLTIQPGTQVEGNGHSITAFGKLSAKGTSASPILLNETVIAMNDNSDGDGRIEIDFAQINGGRYDGVGYGSLDLRNSTISNLHDRIDAFYPEGGNTVISNNVFVDSGAIDAGTLDYGDHGSLTVSGNIFDRYYSYDGQHSPGYEGVALTTYNGSDLRSVQSIGNSFLDTNLYAIDLQKYGRVSSKGDYFKTREGAKISDYIYDRNDDLSVENYADVTRPLSSPPANLKATMLSFVSISLPREIIVDAQLFGTYNANLTGNKLNNKLIGNGGNNIIDGGLGADTMIGGAGNDTYIVDNVRDVILENSGKGYDRVVVSVSYTLAANVEMLTLAGTKAINATGNALANHLIGNDAANALDGKGGADTMEGGAGNDVYFVDHASDRVIEAVGEGRDTVVTTVSYKLAAGQQIEVLQTSDAKGTAALKLTGNTFSNKLVGNAGNNVLDGGAGIDEMRGGAGDDTYAVDHARDIVVEAIGGGTDTVMASVSYTLAAGQEIESLRLHRSTGSTTLDLTGNEFAQALIGNDGANVLDSRLGNDTMVGRGGADTFVFSTAIGTGNVDHITDFAAVDTIRLSKSVFTALAPGQLSATAFKDIGTGKVDADDRILYDSRYGLLSYDADGSGKAAAVQFAVLDNKTAITHADFLIA